jgi:hypothetical protein
MHGCIVQVSEEKILNFFSENPQYVGGRNVPKKQTEIPSPRVGETQLETNYLG